jgi:GT2 family glycosyltransferase
MWPNIKQKYPDAELHFAYGWNTFDAMLANNPERQAWKVHMISAMQQEGITEHGRLGKKELKELRQHCGILAYPSSFFEIFCIGVVEAQLDGCVPVVTQIGALSETVEAGVIVEGDINETEVKKEYLKELLDLMGDENRRKKLAKQGMEFAKQFDWSLVAKQWETEMKTKDESVKVTIFTPTIRKGWWNIMSDNISKQTYKNIEWIIVDDYPEDRKHLAKEYAEKYNLDIKYLRGKKRKIKRTYGLCNANNTMLDAATGEIIVFLQDFVLMPTDGIEQIVTLYKRNPRALQGLPDMYFYSKDKPDTSKEDWFNGSVDQVGEYIRQNIRIANLGLRKTDNPMDYEQNYGAIPTAVAHELGGWHEFFDEGLGWDNTDIAWRAQQLGCEIIIDETNVAICLDHWKALEGTKEHGLGRERNLNDPRYFWMKDQITANKLPLVRTQEGDDKIDLQYEIPKDVDSKVADKWMKEHLEEIISKWV